MHLKPEQEIEILLAFPNVVQIFSDSDCTQYIGSGVVLSPRYVLTCAHVADKGIDVHMGDKLGQWVVKQIDGLPHPVAAAHFERKRDESHDDDLALFEMNNDLPLDGATVLFGLDADFWQYYGSAKFNDGNGKCGALGGFPFRKVSLGHFGQKIFHPDGSTLEITVAGGVPDGHSGGPIVLSLGNELVCVGLARLGGKGKGSSQFIGSDTIQKFLVKKHPHVWKGVMGKFRRYLPISRRLRTWIRSPGRTPLLLALMLWIGIIAFRELSLSPFPAVNKSELGHLLHDNSWLLYDPSHMTLDSRGVARNPDLRSIERDLDIIAQSGFQGIVTSGSEGNMVHVPRLANLRNLKVIMGVFDPSKKRELSRAIRESRYVDAYTLGHSRLGVYSEDTLRSAIDFVKSRTGKPVSISEKIDEYDESLASLGDWLFPDAHLTLLRSPNESSVANEYAVNVEADVRNFVKNAQGIAHWSRDLDRPLVFNGVAYPHSGIYGASPSRQCDFFRKLREALREQHRLRVAFTIVPQTTFDCPWKENMKDSRPWDPYTGLLDLTAADNINVTQIDNKQLLRPAAKEILSWNPSTLGRQKN